MFIVRIIQSLNALAAGLATTGFAFRALAYQRFPIGMNEPYNAADVLDALFMLGVLATVVVLFLVSVFNIGFPGRYGRTWGIRGTAAAVIVGLLYIPLHWLAMRLAEGGVGSIGLGLATSLA